MKIMDREFWGRVFVVFLSCESTVLPAFHGSKMTIVDCFDSQFALHSQNPVEYIQFLCHSALILLRKLALYHLWRCIAELYIAPCGFLLGVRSSLLFNVAVPRASEWRF